MKGIVIDSQVILPGEEKLINLNIANLPSRTKIDIPIFVSRSRKEGPTLLIMAGMHGDEVNSIDIVREILDKKINRPIIGSTITIPILNVYGFLNFSRYLANGKDINRNFPGSKTGSLASRVAHLFMKEILPYVDVGIDFHTGGESRTNFPQIRCDFNDFISLELAEAFSPPFIINASLRPKSLRATASKLNKPIIVYEGGESLRFNKLALEEGIKGLQRLLFHLKMSKSKPETNIIPIKINKMTWVRANASGLFHSFVKYGEFVKKGDVIGNVTDAYGDFLKKIKAPQNGYVIGMNYMPIINQGDPLFNLGLT